MPVLDGIQATRQMSGSRLAGVHVVILTNYGLASTFFQRCGQVRAGS